LAAPLSASKSAPGWRVSGKCERCTHECATRFAKGQCCLCTGTMGKSSI
jgi:hypothetical protein